MFGTVKKDRIQFNEDTLWTGTPGGWNNPKSLAVLPLVRQLVFEGRYREATEVSKQMQGPFNQAYQHLDICTSNSIMTL